ncbi:hypothetical protein J6590_005940 [Homalodisca vitripennis]|nr:hypothetical protein J6590_005940 [Homalodisca vitripennis]
MKNPHWRAAVLLPGHTERCQANVSLINEITLCHTILSAASIASGIVVTRFHYLSSLTSPRAEEKKKFALARAIVEHARNRDEGSSHILEDTHATSRQCLLCGLDKYVCYNELVIPLYTLDVFSQKVKLLSPVSLLLWNTPVTSMKDHLISWRTRMPPLGKRTVAIACITAVVEHASNLDEGSSHILEDTHASSRQSLLCGLDKYVCYNELVIPLYTLDVFSQKEQLLSPVSLLLWNTPVTSMKDHLISWKTRMPALGRACYAG